MKKEASLFIRFLCLLFPSYFLFFVTKFLYFSFISLDQIQLSSFSVVLDTKLIFRLFMHTIFFAHTQNTVILYAFFGSIQKRIFYSNFNHFQPWFYLIDCIKTPPIKHMHFSKLCLKYQFREITRTNCTTIW